MKGPASTSRNGGGGRRNVLALVGLGAVVVMFLLFGGGSGDGGGITVAPPPRSSPPGAADDTPAAASSGPTPPPTPAPTLYDPSTETVDASVCTPLVDYYLEVPDRCPQTGRIISRWISHPTVAARKHWNIIDVGGNKGYGVASIIDELKLAGQKGLGVARTALALFRFGIDKVGGNGCENIAGLCGSCCDCASWLEYDPKSDGVEGPAATTGAELPGTWHAFVFEPTRANTEFLANFYGDPARVALATKGKGQVTVYGETAASDVTELGQMPDVGLGTEFMSISAGHAGRTIQKITLDAAIPASVEYVDLLLTDTEGHDYMVSDGARRFLDAGNVGLYIFELWGKDRSLKEHLKRVEAAGMACYVLIRPHTEVNRKRTVARVRSDCGSDHYFTRFVGWQNALCVNVKREPELAQVFETLAVTEQKPMPDLCEIPHFQAHTVTFARKHADDEPWAQEVLQRCRNVRPLS